MDLEVYVRTVLLENALQHGSARAQSVVGAVMREFPEQRDAHQDVVALAKRIADEVNALSPDEQQDALNQLGGSQAPEKESSDPFHIEQDNPVLRFEPSPSGPMHIGHTFPLGLNHLLAAQNDGTLILRIADTNPENIFPDAYTLLEEDAQWYTHENISDVYIQSDRMELYYTYAERMLTEGWGYVCTCDPEAFKELLSESTACPCRDLSPAVQLERWELMKTDYLPGEAVARVKTDLTHKNPAMRDWPALRINTSLHPRTQNKYRVWPLMNFSVSVDDIEMGMTHVLRAKDHADNAKRQAQFRAHVGAPPLTVYNVGRINFTDLKLSTSTTRKAIEEGTYTGWDDIRLPFLPALRRRGYQAEAFLRLAKETGLSAADKKVSQQEYFTSIDAFNKEVIEPVADRAFFVANPQEITVEGAPAMTVEKDLHPDLRHGGRTLHLQQKVLVDPTDIADGDDVLFRLMDAYNFRQGTNGFVYVSDDVKDYRAAKKKRILHYVPPDEAVRARVHMPDGSWVEGMVEKRVADYAVGTLLQFERVGFVRLDKQQPLEFWFAHK